MSREPPQSTDYQLPTAPLGMSEDGRVPKRIEGKLRAKTRKRTRQLTPLLLYFYFTKRTFDFGYEKSRIG
jgi:hypothetical protein